MEYTIVKSREIVWCSDDDRYVLIIKENGDVVGLNFMQGDELEVFEEQYNYIDQNLTNFYNSIRFYLGGITDLDRINQAIWAYFDFMTSKLVDDVEKGL